MIAMFTFRNKRLYTAKTDMDAYVEARTDTKTFTANWLNYCNRENKYIVYVHMNTYANVQIIHSHY